MEFKLGKHMTTPDPDATARVDSDVRSTPRGRGQDAQFAPGTIVAGRYRIGRGCWPASGATR